MMMTVKKVKLILTNHCDQTCHHCPHSRLYSKNSSHIELYNLERELLTLKSKYKQDVSLLITGGEPLLHPQINEILPFSNHYEEIYLPKA